MPQVVIPDLSALADGSEKHALSQLDLTWVEHAKGRSALRLRPLKAQFAVDDAWVIPLHEITLANGIIEFDALGQSEPPQSNFLGIAFRVVDDRTYDAIYFRPFNFHADDPERRSHAVQYISHPDHPWFALRRDQPGAYEQPILPAPDGDRWFTVQIVVERPTVRVFVNRASEPNLVVEELTAREEGGVGLWVGPGQGGYLSNVRITPTG